MNSLTPNESAPRNGRSGFQNKKYSSFCPIISVFGKKIRRKERERARGGREGRGEEGDAERRPKWMYD